MSDAGSSYEDFGLFEFSEQDLMQLDDVAASAYSFHGHRSQDTVEEGKVQEESNNGGPRLQVEIEESGSDGKSSLLPDALQTPQEDSPYSRHRAWRNLLSVTDLTSIYWCELQTDYGLRQGRHLPVAARPDVFKSSSGKDISVVKTVAVDNEKTLQRGRSVHKKLEKEIRPVEIRVQPTTDEERWALRLIDMVACLSSLMNIGKAREMPVFGLIENQAVVGVIDEITRIPFADASSEDASQITTDIRRDVKKRKKQKKSEPPAEESSKQTSLTSFFPSSPRKTKPSDRNPDVEPTTSNISVEVSEPPPAPVPTYMLHLSDSKTRRSSGLPPDEDALTSRLQLMLYHRLLSNLLKGFDFELLWIYSDLDSRAPFSDTFLESARPLLGDEVTITCLDDVVALWSAQCMDLHVKGIDSRLSIVYRKQTYNAKRKRMSKDQEEADVQKAIAASLQDQGVQGGVAPIQDTIVSASSAPEQAPRSLSGLSDNLSPATISAETPDPGVNGTMPPNAVEPKPLGPTETKNEPTLDSNIIGTKMFTFDSSMLDDYLQRSMQYWYGLREPQGVPVDLVRRCFTCEYYEGCEWRTSKGEETLRKYKDQASKVTGSINTSKPV